jgi:hypothetical protein
MDNSKENNKTILSTGELVATLTGYSPATISMVLNGKRKNVKIEQVAKDISDLQQILFQKYKVINK